MIASLLMKGLHYEKERAKEQTANGSRKGRMEENERGIRQDRRGDGYCGLRQGVGRLEQGELISEDSIRMIVSLQSKIIDEK